MKTSFLALTLLASLHTDGAFAADVTQDTYVDEYGTISLAIALINAPADEQYEMVVDLYDANPRLADEVMDVADELGADTNELGIVIAIIADSKNPDTSGWNYPQDEYHIDGWHIENFSTYERGEPQTYDRSGNDTVKWIPGINAKSDTVSIGRLKDQYLITNCRAELDGIPTQMALMQSF
jgi:hypothetical protein